MSLNNAWEKRKWEKGPKRKNSGQVLNYQADNIPVIYLDET